MTTRQRRTPPRALLLLTFGVLALLPAATVPTAPFVAGGASEDTLRSTTEVAPVAVRDDLDPGSSDPPRFGWPLPGRPEVARPFAAPSSPFGPGHRGIDLAAAPGTPVYAAGEGVVVFAGTLAGRGVVSIDHHLLRTTYEPVKPVVTTGEQVYAGQRIGTLRSGHPGCVPTCLHWGVRRGTAPPEYLNPLPLLTAHSSIRLKPWPD